MQAKESMTKKLQWVSPKENAASVFAKMTKSNVRHMPVLENGELVGILSDRDLLLHAQAGQTYQFPSDLSAGDIMSNEPVTANGESTLADIARTMLELKIDAMPITDQDDVLIGLVTVSDLLRLIAQRDECLLGFSRTKDLCGKYAWDLTSAVLPPDENMT